MRKIKNMFENFRDNKRQHTILWGVVVLVFFAVLLIINTLTPLIADDFYYRRNLVYGENTPVRSLGDVVRSAQNVYVYNSGRVLTHLMYHLFGTIGKGAFNLLNSVSYVVVTFFLYSIIRNKGRHSIVLYVLVNLSIWMFTPELGQDIFWLSGTINYLLPMLPVLGMLFIYRRGSRKDAPGGLLKCIALFVLGVIAGWQLENLSIVVPVTAFLYIIYFKRVNKRVPGWSIFGLAGSVCGYALLILAPGNFKRYDMATQSVSLSVPFKFAMITYYWIMFAGILTIIFVVSAIYCVRRKRKEAFLQGSVFAVAAIVSAYCMMGAPTSPERTWFITISLMIIADGILLGEFFAEIPSSSSVKAAVCLGSLIILGAMAADTMLSTYEIHQQFTEREQMIVTAKKNGIADIQVPVYGHKYPLKANRDALYGLRDVELGTDPPNSFNVIIAEYYGVNSITGIERPEEID